MTKSGWPVEEYQRTANRSMNSGVTYRTWCPLPRSAGRTCSTAYRSRQSRRSRANLEGCRRAPGLLYCNVSLRQDVSTSGPPPTLELIRLQERQIFEWVQGQVWSLAFGIDCLPPRSLLYATGFEDVRYVHFLVPFCVVFWRKLIRLRYLAVHEQYARMLPSGWLIYTSHGD